MGRKRKVVDDSALPPEERERRRVQKQLQVRSHGKQPPSAVTDPFILLGPK